MSARYAYFGIGVVMMLAIAAFVIPKKAVAPENTVAPESVQRIPTFSLSSPAFEADAMIPSMYTCDEKQVSPPLIIANVPAGTKSFAVIMEDPDVPKQLMPSGVFLHWVMFSIPVTTTEIRAGESVGVLGTNGAGKASYIGPCPPKEYMPDVHRYVFTLYALDAMLDLKTGASKDDVVKSMQGHVLGQTELIGKYKKK